MKALNRLSTLEAWALAAAWSFVTGVSAWGAAPLGQSFSYQGRLEFNGVAINDTCDFEFSLWDDPGGITQIGATQTIPGVAVTSGLFTVELNAGGEFGTNAFNGEARWLQIAVRCPPEGTSTTLSPRQPLTAAPYALYALNGPTAGPSPWQRIRGAWLFETGSMLRDFDSFLNVTGLVLEDNGTGRVFFREIVTGAEDCARVFALFDGQTLVIDFGAEPASQLTCGGS